MMMGPEPTIRIESRSVRRGILVDPSVHEVSATISGHSENCANLAYAAGPCNTLKVRPWRAKLTLFLEAGSPAEHSCGDRRRWRSRSPFRPPGRERYLSPGRPVHLQRL